MLKSGQSWRIDTLDARGGLAFASWRDSELVSGKDAGSDRPCIFVGAPDFRPEPVANRAIAFAASRGAFQIGLFVEDAEVPFPTTASVAEFVRRTYARSGGGDGADGGGGNIPPPRPPDRPDLPRSPDIAEEEVVGQRLRPAILKGIAEFQESSTSLDLGEVRHFNYWPTAIDRADQRSGSAATCDGPAILASAALQLIVEMIQRLPFSGGAYKLMQWQHAACSLDKLLSDCDLWTVLFAEPYRQSIKALADGLLAYKNPGFAFFDVANEIPDDSRAYFTIIGLFRGGLEIEDRSLLYMLMERIYYGSERYAFGVFPEEWNTRSDTISDLCRIPLPKELQSFVGFDLGDRASLYHALTAFVGSPNAILDQKLGALVDVVLFASACITSAGRRPSLPSAVHWSFDRRWSARPKLSPMRRAAMTAHLDGAWSWLRDQLPVIVFAKPIEEVIKSAADLRYTAK